jgi:hypothetical protein
MAQGSPSAYTGHSSDQEILSSSGTLIVMHMKSPYAISKFDFFLLGDTV